MLSWNEIVAAHFREKVALHHRLGPYKQNVTAPPAKKAKSDSESQEGSKVIAEPAKSVESVVSNSAKSVSLSATNDRTSSITSVPGSSAKPMTAGPIPPWTPAPCPMGAQTPDVITEADMKNVLLKYNLGHPKCNAPLQDTSLLGKSFVRSAIFGVHSRKSLATNKISNV